MKYVYAQTRINFYNKNKTFFPISNYIESYTEKLRRDFISRGELSFQMSLCLEDKKL